jgi:hypothetical protein
LTGLISWSPLRDSKTAGSRLKIDVERLLLVT